MGTTYRLRQLWRNLSSGPLDSAGRSEIAETLTAAELALFDQYPLTDQQHSYRVFKTLKDAGKNQPDLLAASLLHDIGKTRVSMTNWDRSVAVVLDAVWPGRIDEWGDGEAIGWQRPFVVRKQHAEWGAELAAAAGSQPLVVTLIRHHQDEPATIEDVTLRSLLEQLQWSDNQN